MAPEITENKGEEMNNFTQMFSETTKDQLDAMKLGGGMAASVAAEEIIVETFHELLKESGVSIPTFLNSSTIRTYVEPLVLGFGIQLATKLWPNLPAAKTLSRVGYLAAASKWAEISKPLFRQVGRFATRFLTKLKTNPLTQELVAEE
jgi:hypothetical protein